MNRRELIESVAQRAGLEKRQADAAVDAVLDQVIAATKSGEKVSLLGFGTFTPTSRAARTGRNPQTGAPVKIAASRSVRFAPGLQFKTALNPKAAAKRSGATKASAKKSGATSASAKKAPAKSQTKKAPSAKKAPAKKAPAKKAAASIKKK